MSSASRSLRTGRANSLEMQYFISVVALVVTMARAQDLDCEVYCKSLYTNQRGGPLTLPPNCVCSKHTAKKLTSHQLSKPAPTFLQNDNVIYYEPSGAHPPPSIPFVEKPFYITNPTFHKQNHKKDATNTEWKIDVNYLSKSRRSLKEERKKYVKKVSLEKDKELEEVFIYLDINISGELLSQEIYDLDYFQLSEEDLTECIDLHILMYSRNSGIEKDLEDILDVETVNKYKSLSTAELLIEIESKCKDLANVVKNSLQEITDSSPKKSKHKSSKGFSEENTHNAFITSYSTDLRDAKYALNQDVLKISTNTESSTEMAYTKNDVTEKRDIEIYTQSKIDSDSTLNLLNDVHSETPVKTASINSNPIPDMTEKYENNDPFNSNTKLPTFRSNTYRNPNMVSSTNQNISYAETNDITHTSSDEYTKQNYADTIPKNLERSITTEDESVFNMNTDETRIPLECTSTTIPSLRTRDSISQAILTSTPKKIEDHTLENIYDVESSTMIPAQPQLPIKNQKHSNKHHFVKEVLDETDNKDIESELMSTIQSPWSSSVPPLPTITTFVNTTNYTSTSNVADLSKDMNSNDSFSKNTTLLTEVPGSKSNEDLNKIIKHGAFTTVATDTNKEDTTFGSKGHTEDGNYSTEKNLDNNSSSEEISSTDLLFSQSNNIPTTINGVAIIDRIYLNDNNNHSLENVYDVESSTMIPAKTQLPSKNQKHSNKHHIVKEELDETDNKDIESELMSTIQLPRSSSVPPLPPIIYLLNTTNYTSSSNIADLLKDMKKNDSFSKNMTLLTEVAENRSNEDLNKIIKHSAFTTVPTDTSKEDTTFGIEGHTEDGNHFTGKNLDNNSSSDELSSTDLSFSQSNNIPTAINGVTIIDRVSLNHKNDHLLVNIYDVKSSTMIPAQTQFPNKNQKHSNKHHIVKEELDETANKDTESELMSTKQSPWSSSVPPLPDITNLVSTTNYTSSSNVTDLLKDMKSSDSFSKNTTLPTEVVENRSNEDLNKIMKHSAYTTVAADTSKKDTTFGSKGLTEDGNYSTEKNLDNNSSLEEISSTDLSFSQSNNIPTTIHGVTIIDRISLNHKNDHPLVNIYDVESSTMIAAKTQLPIKNQKHSNKHHIVKEELDETDTKDIESELMSTIRPQSSNSVPPLPAITNLVSTTNYTLSSNVTDLSKDMNKNDSFSKNTTLLTEVAESRSNEDLNKILKHGAFTTVATDTSKEDTTFESKGHTEDGNYFTVENLDDKSSSEELSSTDLSFSQSNNIPTIIKGVTINDRLSLHHNNDHSLRNSHNKSSEGRRIEYPEAELNISKIISKELINETVFSELNGTEGIPNNDFIDDFESVTYYETGDVAPSPDEVKSTVTVGTTGDSNLDETESKYLMGKLYFIFGDKYLPARFVQDGDGLMALGVDGTALCDKLLDTHKSVIINALCKFPQSEKNTVS